MKQSLLCVLSASALLALSSLDEKAQTSYITPAFQNYTNQPGFTTADYTISGFSAESYPAYPTFATDGGAGAWPASIGFNGSPQVSLNHSNPADYTDFLSAASSGGSGGGIYSFFTETGYVITQTDPLAAMASLTLQLFMAAGSDANATSNLFSGLPTLTLTLADSTTEIITAQSNPSIINSGSVTLFSMPSTLNDISFTFNISGVEEPVSSYTIGWASADHSVLYGADVTEAAPVAAPEPRTWALLGLGLVAMLHGWRGRAWKRSGPDAFRRTIA